MKQLVALVIVFVSLTSCSKDNGDDHEDPNQPLVFTSLSSVRYNIAPGDTTTITAVASGYRITYIWSKSAGDILGTGRKVIYAASPCHIGRNKITCEVKDGHYASQVKEIYIVVE